jgi:membrane associated rhomboid family serine protease
MSSSADLFVVCKNCGSEVSPYITECPYCGHRLRRRAPKLPRENVAGRPRRRLLRRWPARAPNEGYSPARAPLLARRPRAGSIAERPYVTIALVTASCVLWVLLRGGFIAADKLVVIGPLRGDWWKLLTSQFAYLNGLYAFVALIVVAIFGWLLERRHGPVLVLALFLGAGVTGALVAIAAYPVALVSGANAGALALLAAWAAPDLMAARREHYYEGDLLGAGVLAALLLAIPFALVIPEASWLAGVTGGALGLLVGLGLQRFERAEL